MRLRLCAVVDGMRERGRTCGAGGCGRPPRTMSAAVAPLPHLGATGAGVPGPAVGAGAGAGAACAGACAGAATGGGPGLGAAFLGAGMPLPAPGPAALPPDGTMGR